MIMILDLGCGENIREDATHALDWRDIEDFPKDKIQFIKHDLCELPLPFESESTEKVYMIHLIEHFSRIRALKILKDVHRILIPKGILHLETPNIYKVIEWLFREGRRDFEQTDIPAWGSPAKAIWSEEYYNGAFHHYGYSDVTLERIIKEAGFTIINHNDYNTYALIIMGEKDKMVI